MEEKVLIIGPLEDVGGRELEAGFIAGVLKEKYRVKILSTGNITKKSQIYDIAEGIPITSLKQQLLRKYWTLLPSTVVSYFRNGRKEPIFFYVNNKINSRYLKQKEYSVLRYEISKHDLIILIAHVETLRTMEIIQLSQELKKPIIFRTTGEILLPGDVPRFLEKVNLFLHHSVVNARSLHARLQVNNYAIIDQSSYIEPQLLKISVVGKKVKKFAAIGRLAPEKNLINLVSHFEDSCESGDQLFIIGTGELYSELRTLIANSRNIKLLGHIPHKELYKIYQDFDCAIIPAYTEAGPLVGIDAMAAGKIILSTRVGAMPERLRNSFNDFWFEPNDRKSFKVQYDRIKDLEPVEVRKIAERNRNIYKERYSKRILSRDYLKLVTKTLNYISDDIYNS